MVELKSLHGDPVLSHIPLVGVAMTLDDNERNKQKLLEKSKTKSQEQGEGIDWYKETHLISPPPKKKKSMK